MPATVRLIAASSLTISTMRLVWSFFTKSNAAPCVGALAGCSPHPIPVSGAAKLLMLIVIAIVDDREKSAGRAGVIACALKCTHQPAQNRSRQPAVRKSA